MQNYRYPGCIAPGSIAPARGYTIYCKALTATQQVPLNPVAWHRLGTGKKGLNQHGTDWEQEKRGRTLIEQSVCALQDALRSRFTNGF